ncbi:ribonuclease Z [Candidatus Pacearchaeota archaeon]|nr:ribonuclease Z [Candidatus Pacearchaeota archaeon]|tara:strand:- start:565 stop:1470 length:906 start_codon:yes stop_codon:yes gene_type:complete
MTEKIKLTFLGTGSAIPTARRNHPAMLLQFKDENILVDCGEGTQRQFRKAKLNPCKITKILITHWHGDHTLGLPGLLQTLALNSYNKTLKIYGPKGTKRFMQLYLGLFIHREKINIQVHEVTTEKPVDQKEFSIQAKEMKHGTPTLAYAFIIKEKNRLDKNKLKKMKIPNSPLLSKLAKGKTITINNKKIDPKKLIYAEPQRKITFIMDTVFTPSAIAIAKDSDILICESTYNNQGKDFAKQYLHLTSTQAATIAKKSNSKKLFLTHLSQRNEANPKIILSEAKQIFKETEIAEDLLQVEI